VKSEFSKSSLTAGATIFFSNVCLMILEIVAGRLAARYIGASLYTWTSVIGVVLGGITLGYYLGGRLADRFASREVLGWLFAGSSISCVAVVAINNPVGEWTLLWRLEMSIRVLAHISVVFLIPTILIGAVSPVTVKTALEEARHKGRTVGRMYALGAAGSIMGTFLAGFWLIAAIGSVNTVWVVSTMMLLGAVVYLPKPLVKYSLAGVVGFVIAVGTVPTVWAEHLGAALGLRQIREPDILYETESQYGYIAVRQVSKQPDERQFIQDNMENHSRLIMGDIRDFQLFYSRMYAAVTHRAAGDKEKFNVLSIGGGGYVFPRYIQDVWPGSHVDVVEIDPSVTEAATRAFGLKADTPIQTINLDGRNYVDGLLERKRRGEKTPEYDFVYMDAFNDMSVPFQLVTKQFNEKIFDITAADGVYMVNTIDMLDSSRFISSFVYTISRTFPYVYVTGKLVPGYLPNNFVVIASKRPVNLEGLSKEEFFKKSAVKVFDNEEVTAIIEKAGRINIDDDYAPTENLMAPTVRQSAAIQIAKKYIEQAKELSDAGETDKAISKCRQAIRASPAWMVKGYYEMGKILANHNRYAEAAEALRSALEGTTPEDGGVFTSLLHYFLGVTLKKLGDRGDALAEFDNAIELLNAELESTGGTSEIYSHLGQVYAVKGDMKEATEFFEQALKEEPNNINNHITLIRALMFQKRYGEAKQQLQKSVDYMQSNGRNKDTEQLEKLIIDY